MLGDMGSPFVMSVVADGVSSMLDCNAAPVEPQSINVITSPNNGTTWTAPLALGTDYTVDAFNGKLIFQNPPAQGNVVLVRGVSYVDWTDTDLVDFIQIAFLQHTYHRNPPVVLNAVAGAIPPTQVLPANEERAVAILAVIESYWDLATAKAKNFTIDTGDGTVIPLAQQYEHIMSHIDRLMARYEDLAQKLGVGLYAIEVLTLRRKSRMIGTLVPVYVDQEIEGRFWPPDRALPPIPVLANIRIHYCGIFSLGTQYNINDEVIEGGVTYVALAANIDIDPYTDTQAGDGITGLNWKQSWINNTGYGYGYTW
jgi:hypothetical protein